MLKHYDYKISYDKLKTIVFVKSCVKTVSKKIMRLVFFIYIRFDMSINYPKDVSKYTYHCT